MGVLFVDPIQITLGLFNSLPWEMAHRNRLFTELENGGSFHGELLVIARG